MRLLVSVCCLCFAPVLPAATLNYQLAGDDPGPWPQIFASIGITRSSAGPANLYVVRSSAASASQFIPRIEQGATVILEGESELARALGIAPGDKRVVVRGIVDQRAPKLPIVWESPVEIPIFKLPNDATVLAWERWQHAPVLAALHRGKGAVLWLAASPSPSQTNDGYQRFPYLLQALADLGMQPPFQSQRLWAFFDGAYRSRVDLDYFADRWRKAGIGAIHVAGWHYYEQNPESDDYLRRLIEACHRKAILVYVWLELPHVSEKFWDAHPDWREQTAILQDAQLDWRKLMNLNNPDCSAAVSEGIRQLIGRFDWDGVNLAELYFESLEGAANPARFTPMNKDVRAEFLALHNWDPIDLFRSANPDPQRLRQFLDYRADLARRQQEQWIGRIESIRASKPDLDFVLTHVDDRFDTRMHDLIGADAARALPLLDRHDFTFLIEDPATIWNLGPQRYPQIASRYQPLTSHSNRLAIDINIVERYQDVYPTKQQTGTELFELVHLAAQSFARVALYFENSIATPDLGLLASAAANVDKAEQNGTRLFVESHRGVGIPWQGPALVNGRPWPVRSDTTLWLAPGPNVVEPAPLDPKESPLRLIDFNGDLRSASAAADGLQFSYESSARALALLNTRPQKLEVDGAPRDLKFVQSGAGFLLTLPRGQHIVEVTI